MKNILLIFITATALLACKKQNNCFVTKGDVVTKTDTLPSFSSVTIDNGVNVVYYKAANPKIEITTGDNFIDYITYKVVNNELMLKNEIGCKVLRGKFDEVEIKVFSPALNEITLRGNGKISSPDTLRNNFTFNSFANQGSAEFLISNDSTRIFMESGSTDLTLRGTTNYCWFYNFGINHFFGRAFAVNTFRMHNAANSITQATVTNIFLIEQNGDGDIEYWGNPAQVDTNSYQGNGKIIAY